MCNGTEKLWGIAKSIFRCAPERDYTPPNLKATEMRNKTTNIYTEWLPLIDSQPNESAGELFKTILKYQNGDDVSNDNPVWLFIKSKIDEYNEKGKQISEKRKENGKLGGLAKASKCYQMLANDSKSSNKIKENKIKQNKIKENYKESFDEFWGWYPKKRAGSKQKSYKAFCRAIKEGRATEEQLIRSARDYSDSDEVRRGFAKGCEAWLNDDRFNNEYKRIEQEEWDAGYGRR